MRFSNEDLGRRKTYPGVCPYQARCPLLPPEACLHLRDRALYSVDEHLREPTGGHARLGRAHPDASLQRALLQLHWLLH